MSVTATSDAAANAVTAAASSYIKQKNGGDTSSPAASALEESKETHQETVQEAAKGDPTAKRLLAKQQQLKQLEDPAADPAPAKEPGKGDIIDQQA